MGLVYQRSLGSTTKTGWSTAAEVAAAVKVAGNLVGASHYQTGGQYQAGPEADHGGSRTNQAKAAEELTS
jgi:hypothetical protein